MKKHNLPKTIPVFPLSNFIIFPHTTVPLNIFEPRYVEMINDSMKSDKLIGMIQPLSLNKIAQTDPGLHQVGCLGKIISFKETENGYEVTGEEGFVAVDRIGNALKLVDRLEFSRLNFGTGMPGK